MDNATITEELADIVKPDFEIVGLSSRDNNHSCCQHKCCGEQVKENDVVRLLRCMVPTNNKMKKNVDSLIRLL